MRSERERAIMNRLNRCACAAQEIQFHAGVRAGQRFYHFARIKQLDISITRAHLYVSRRLRSGHAICGHTSGNVYSSLLACCTARIEVDVCVCVCCVSNLMVWPERERR